MKLLPRVDTSTDDYGLDITKTYIVVSIVYVSIFAYSYMLWLELHNVYFFLYKQRKYKVFCLTLFYILVIPCTILRIIYNLYTMHVEIDYCIIGNLYPVIFKICIGY